METLEPFQNTVAPEMNPEPFTVRVNAGPPADVELGLSDETVGATEGASTQVSVSDVERLLPPNMVIRPEPGSMTIAS